MPPLNDPGGLRKALGLIDDQNRRVTKDPKPLGGGKRGGCKESSLVHLDVEVQKQGLLAGQEMPDQRGFSNLTWAKQDDDFIPLE